MQDDFPRLIEKVNWHPTSDATAAYNCFAWAVWSEDDYIWPDSTGLVQWDPTLPCTDTVRTIELFLEKIDFVGCALDDSYVKGWEKVAIYAAPDGTPQHLARQLVEGPREGQWTSKMAESVDVSHNDLQVLEGPQYGRVASILKRPFNGRPKLPPLQPNRPKFISADGRPLF